jgi:hypothetical protein
MIMDRTGIIRGAFWAACVYVLCGCAASVAATAGPSNAAVATSGSAPSSDGEFRSRLQALGEQHGLQISWQGGPFRYEGDWGWGEARQASDWEIGMFTPILIDEINLYPRTFLHKRGVERIVLARDLWLQEEGVAQNVAGYIFEDRIILMSVSYDYKVNNRDKQRRYLHHLIWHQVDAQAGTMWRDPQWEALNPPGFKYGVYTKGGIHDRSSESGLISTQYPGFVNRYSTGYLPDDKADVFAYLMVAHHWMMERAGEDPFLRRKIELIKQRLAALDPAFDAGFWAAVHAIRRDVKVYATP